MASLISLLISILILVSAAGYGRAISGLWRAKSGSRLENAVVDIALGLGFISLIFFFLGVFQLYSDKRLLFAVLVPGLVCERAGLLRELIGSIRESKNIKLAPGQVLLAVLLFMIVITSLVLALAPPSMGDWDSLAYHLTMPKLYLQHGGFYYISFSSHSEFPFLMEMLYLPGLALGNPVAAKLMHYWMGILLIASVMLLVKRHFNPKAAPLAALALAGMPIVLYFATTAYVDLATALYTVLCVYLLLNYFDTDDRRYLIGCAVSAGFAASTKMTGLSILPLLVIWLIADRYAAKKKIEWKRALMLICVALLTCATWYIKTYIYTGNPVYPFFYSIFGGKDWNAELAQIYTTSQAKFGMGHNLKSLLLLPYNLLANSWAFYDQPGLYIGPIFLVGVPVLLLLLWKRNRKLTGLAGFFIGQVAIWFMLTHQSRYLIPAFAVLAVLIAAIIYQDERLRVIRGLLYGVFALTAIFGLWTILPSAVLSAGMDRQEYLKATLDIYPADTWMNGHLPKDANVILFADTRGFYLNRNFVWGDYGHNIEFSWHFNSVEDFTGFLKSKHITHAMINYMILPKPDDATGTAEWIYKAIQSDKFKQVFPNDNTGHVAVYEIR